MKELNNHQINKKLDLIMEMQKAIHSYNQLSFQMLKKEIPTEEDIELMLEDQEDIQDIIDRYEELK